MSLPEETGKRFPSSIPRQYLLCFFSTVLWGLVAHGMALFNKYSLYEDVSQLFGVGATYQSGRWMLDILHRMEVLLWGGSFSLPLVNGLATIIFIAITGCLLCRLFDFKRSAVCIALGGILVTTPVLTGTFGYMFTAPHYAFGLLMGVLGVSLLCSRRTWYGFVSGAVLIACGIGVYQAVLAAALCLMLLRFMKDISCEEAVPFRYLLWQILYLLVGCAAFMLLYLGINKLYLHITDAVLTSYQGIDTAGKLSLSTYASRAFYAYREFFSPNAQASAYMYSGGIRWIYRISQVVAGIMTVLLLVSTFKKHTGRFLLLLVAAILLPFAFNFIYVMCDPSQVHSLMVYNHVFLYVYLLWTGERLLRGMKPLGRKCRLALICLVLAVSGLFARYDNICYLKAEFVQAQTIRYYTTMVTRIQSTAGYRDDMAVNYVNFFDKEDASLTENHGLDCVITIPYYDTNDMINSFAGSSFIKYWCGFDPVRDYTDYTQDPQVQAMPCYPDNGSIAIINDTVIVKFAP